MSDEEGVTQLHPQERPKEPTKAIIIAWSDDGVSVTGTPQVTIADWALAAFMCTDTGLTTKARASAGSGLVAARTIPGVKS